MRLIRLSILFTIMIGLFGSNAFAQVDNKLVSVALVKKDSIVLRWVPASIPVWQIGVKYGYIIKRYTIAKGGVFIPDGLSKGEMLTPTPILPVSNDAFEIIASSDPRIAIVQEAIYGTDFQLLSEGQGFSGFMKAYNDLEVRFGFALLMCDLSSVIAKAAGLQFIDRNVLPDERYAYSISLVNVPDGMQVDPSVIVLDAGQVTVLPEIVQVQAVFLDKAVKLQWPVMFYEGTYTAYSIEKSTDGKNFAPVSDLPVVNISEEESPGYFVYTDSLSSNNTQTWYRIKGISPFGEEGPASEIVEGKGAPEFTAYAVIDTSEVIDNNKVILHWRVTQNESAPVKDVDILRSDKYDGVYVNLTSKPLASDTRMFTDTRPGISNYYKVMLTGKDNLTSYSFPYLVQTEDNEPPAAPQMLTGKVDSSGIVTIAWKQNEEPDLLGYKIFSANAPHEDFISIGQDIITANIFYDSININTLTKKIYYEITAIDKHYNNSDYSSTLELSRPDTIRPAPAVITRIVVQNGKVGIRFEGSPSNDVNYYELNRITENETTSVIVKTWNENFPALFEDTPPDEGKNYVYLIKTIDFAGNSSENSRSVYIPNTLQKTITLKADQEKSGKSIILSWDIPEGFLPAKTLIYRSKNGEPISIYFTISGVDQLFEDKDIEIGTEYNYRIRIFDSMSSAIINSNLTKVNLLPESASR